MRSNPFVLVTAVVLRMSRVLLVFGWWMFIIIVLMRLSIPPFPLFSDRPCDGVPTGSGRHRPYGSQRQADGGRPHGSNGRDTFTIAFHTLQTFIG